MSVVHAGQAAEEVRGAGGRLAAALARALVIASLALVAGCAAFKPPSSTFDLAAPQEFPKLRGSSRAQLLILEPTAIKTLDGVDIVVRPAHNQLEILARAQWPDRLPKLVQARLVETFENTGRIRAAAKPGQGLLIDYQLGADIRAFDANVAAGSAEVVLSVKLISDRTGRVVASRVFTATAPLSGTDPDAVVGALNRAFDDAARDIVNWTYRII